MLRARKRRPLRLSISPDGGEAFSVTLGEEEVRFCLAAGFEVTLLLHAHALDQSPERCLQEGWKT